MNPEGESRHRHVRAKMARKDQTIMEKKVNGKDEFAVVQSPKRKVIRVESEEALNLSREEAEEISFVPSAVSVSPKLMFRCVNRCGL